MPASTSRAVEPWPKPDPIGAWSASAMFLFLPPWSDLYLEQLRPVLAGDEQTVAFGIVGDAVQHAVGIAVGILDGQLGEVDPALHRAALRVDPGDAVAHPDVGVDFALHIFELVEALDRFAAKRDPDPLALRHRRRIEEAQLAGAVAHDDVLAVLGERPALAGIAELALGAEIG